MAPMRLHRLVAIAISALDTLASGASNRPETLRPRRYWAPGDLVVQRPHDVQVDRQLANLALRLGQRDDPRPAPGRGFNPSRRPGMNSSRPTRSAPLAVASPAPTHPTIPPAPGATQPPPRGAPTHFLHPNLRGSQLAASPGGAARAGSRRAVCTAGRARRRLAACPTSTRVKVAACPASARQRCFSLGGRRAPCGRCVRWLRRRPTCRTAR